MYVATHAAVQGARLCTGLLQRAPEQLWQRLEPQKLVQLTASLLIVTSLAMAKQAGPIKSYIPLPADDQVDKAHGVRDTFCTCFALVRDHQLQKRAFTRPRRWG